jgi:hypothetical protein
MIDLLRGTLAFFGLQIERRDPPPGVLPVDNCAAIASIFDADAARQQNDSTGAGVPKFCRGMGGAKLPNFRIPSHLK